MVRPTTMLPFVLHTFNAKDTIYLFIYLFMKSFNAMIYFFG